MLHHVITCQYVSCVLSRQCSRSTSLSCATNHCVSCRADNNSVSGASFSGQQVLESWPILFRTVDVCEAFNCCVSDDTGMPSQPSEAPSNTRSSSCRNHSSKDATTVFSCTCFEAHSRCNLVKPGKSVVLNETVEIRAEGAIRTIHADGREEESEAVTEHGNSHQGGHIVQAPCPIDGEVGFCEVSDRWWVPRVPFDTRKLYHHSLKHFLIWVAKRISLILNDTQMTTPLATNCDAKYMFGVSYQQRCCLSRLDGHDDPLRVQVARAVTHEPARPSPREERSQGWRPRGVASANASRDRNLGIDFRGSHSWNNPKICLRRRLRREYILHVLLTAMSWPAAFELMVYLDIQCVKIRLS